LTVLAKEGRRSLPLTLVNEQEFVALDDLAAAFQLAVHEEALGALTVSYKNKTIVLTADQALASVSGRLVSLPAPPSRSGRRWLVPVEFINRALSLVYESRLDLRKPSRLLIVGDLRVPRLVVRYDPGTPGGRLTIDATPYASSTVSQDNNRLLIRFDADALDTASPPLPSQGAQSIVESVHLADPLTLAVELGPRFGSFRASTQPADASGRIVIDVLSTQSDTAAAGAAQPAAPAPAPDLSGLAQPVSSVRTIALDPGHGGNDGGVKVPDGVQEKALTLQVAHRVKAIIEARLGIRVFLTRDDDRDLTVDDRAAMANNNKADLLISLHANSSFRPSTSGANIFVARFPAESDRAVRGALTPHRVPTFGGGLRDIELVPWELAQLAHVDQSMEFALIAQRAFQDRVPLSPRAIDSAPFRVLESANMPAVLIEMGYLSNADQAKQLAGNEFQASFAQALLDAVVTFRDRLDERRPALGAGAQ
jgi:N-acetylmuramoyl-L-alanine amidase